MMRRWTSLVFLLIPAILGAQIPTNDPGMVEGGRVAVELRKDLSKKVGFHESTEFRMEGRLLRDIRLHESVGISYTPVPWLKTGVEYTLIGTREYRSDISRRHRIAIEGTGKYKTGPWKFSLREKVQMTHRPGDVNTWQHTRNLLELRSRAMVAYKVDKRWTPFMALEVKNTLNAPSLGDYTFNTATRRYETPEGTVTGEPGWMISDYDDAYINRVRGTVGTDIKINKHNSLKASAFADWKKSLDIDTDHDGTRLKSLVYDRNWRFCLCATYIHSF